MEKKSRPLARTIAYIALILLGVLIYAYGWQVTDINLEEPREVQRQELVMRALRGLLRPDLFERDTDSQIAYAYFLTAMVLFVVQVLGGLLAGWIYISPNTLSEILPFNVVLMLHTNSLIVWLLLGFFGAAYFIIPEEAEREIHSEQLAYIQLAILILGTAGVVVTYVFDLFNGNFFLGKGGREFLEQPLWVPLVANTAACNPNTLNYYSLLGDADKAAERHREAGPRNRSS